MSTPEEVQEPKSKVPPMPPKQADSAATADLHRRAGSGSRPDLRGHSKGDGSTMGSTQMKNKCTQSGNFATHSDGTYIWFCPLCGFRPKVSSARDSSVLRPHRDRRNPAPPAVSGERGQ